jgi:hypothetical protein
VPQERTPRRKHPQPDGVLPVCPAGWRINLADDGFDHPVEKLFLVRDVLVERHRHDAELLGEPPHA